MPWRLQLADDRLFPAQAFFNAVPDCYFVDVVGRLLGGIGAGINDAHCTFPSDLDPGEEPFDGVQFRLFEDEVVITIAELKGLIAQACAAHLVEYPEDRAAVAALLSRDQGDDPRPLDEPLPRSRGPS